MEQTKEQHQIKSPLVKTYLEKNTKRGFVPRNLFEGFNQINNFELEIPDTKYKLVFEIYQNERNPDKYLAAMKVGKSVIFFDGKMSYIVAEVLRELTENIVPPDLKPKGGV